MNTEISSIRPTEVISPLPVEASEKTMVQAAKPVATADRIQTVDLVRGFALLGILMMNIPIFGINGSATQKILSGPHNTADYYTLAVISTLFEGTMRGLFSMLFGAGMIKAKPT